MSKDEFLQRIADCEIKPAAERMCREMQRYQGGAPIHRVRACEMSLAVLITQIEDGKVGANTFGELERSGQYAELFEKMYTSFVNGGYRL